MVSDWQEKPSSVIGRSLTNQRQRGACRQLFGILLATIVVAWRIQVLHQIPLDDRNGSIEVADPFQCLLPVSNWSMTSRQPIGNPSVISH